MVLVNGIIDFIEDDPSWFNFYSCLSLRWLGAAGMILYIHHLWLIAATNLSVNRYVQKDEEDEGDDAMDEEIQIDEIHFYIEWMDS